MIGISTHVLNTATGKPEAGIQVELYQGLTLLCAQTTNSDGRVPAMLPVNVALTPGIYRLRFDVAGDFFPEVNITFDVRDASVHYHVPLLLSPFGYTTYRGS